MQINFFSLCLLLLWSTQAGASQIVRYRCIAKTDEKIAYIEKHTVESSDTGALQKASAEYLSDTGKPLAELKSDFTTSLTVPTHVTNDFGTGEAQGLSGEREKVVMYFKKKDKCEETRTLAPAAGDEKDRVLVGCRGLNFYLLSNLGPNLRVRCDTKKKRIVWYDGISNIENDGRNQKVTINSIYESE